MDCFRVLILLIPLLASAQSIGQNIQNFTYSERYYSKQNRDIKESDMKVKAIFIGNSITYDWKVWNEVFFEPNGYLNRGIKGQVSSEVLQRFYLDVIAMSPQAVVIGIGINDIVELVGPYDEEKVFSNIKKMTEMALKHNIRVLLASVLPLRKIPNINVSSMPNHNTNDVSIIHSRIIRLNERIKKYTEESGTDYVDYYSSMVDADNLLASEYTTEDGVHITKEGYKVMEKVISTTFNRLTNLE